MVKEVTGAADACPLLFEWKSLPGRGKAWKGVEMRPGRDLRLLWMIPALSFILAAVQTGESSAARGARYKRSVEVYEVPDVTLVNQRGEEVNLRDFVYESESPVLLDFIYATCTTICPVLSAGFSNMQRKLGANSERVRLLSVTIDPDYDTPEIMGQYLDRYRALPGWDFFTGSRGNIEAVMKAFDAYVPDKMSHHPLTFLKAPGEEGWVRINGLLNTADLLTEYELLEKR